MADTEEIAGFVNRFAPGKEFYYHFVYRRSNISPHPLTWHCEMGVIHQEHLNEDDVGFMNPLTRLPS